MRPDKGNAPRERRAGPGPGWRPCWQLALLAASSAVAEALAGDGPPGITTPQAFPRSIPPLPPARRRRPGSARCWPLPRTISANSCRASADGLAMAARDRGDWRIRSSIADNDAGKQIEQLQLLLGFEVGAVVAAPGRSGIARPTACSRSSGPVAMSAPSSRRPPPSLLNAPQYLTGKTLGDAAAAYINDHLGRPRQCRPAHPGQPRVSGAALCRHPQFIEGHSRRQYHRRHLAEPGQQGRQLRDDDVSF